MRDARWTHKSKDDSLVNEVAKYVSGNTKWTGERYRSDRKYHSRGTPEQENRVTLSRPRVFFFWNDIYSERGRTEPIKEIYPIKSFNALRGCAETWKASMFSTFEFEFYRDMHLLPHVKWHLWNRHAHFHRSEREPQGRRIVDGDIRTAFERCVMWEHFLKTIPTVRCFPIQGRRVPSFSKAIKMPSVNFVNLD